MTALEQFNMDEMEDMILKRKSRVLQQTESKKFIELYCLDYETKESNYSCVDHWNATKTRNDTVEVSVKFRDPVSLS